MPNKIIQSIRRDLKNNFDRRFYQGAGIFFQKQEQVKLHGVRNPIVCKIAAKYWPEIKKFDRQKIYQLAEELIKTEFLEERKIAVLWLQKSKKQFQPENFKLFSCWLKKYIHNWANCDDFCTHILGEMFYLYPKLLPTTKKWAKSKNRWVRRAAAVSLINPLKKKQCLPEALEIADVLLTDADIMVQKGYGWMLKEAANIYQSRIFNFVIENKSKMPRTALRYAIEKMPDHWRREAMTK